ncbi:hypothetical protein J4436_02485 [Candidatus Woesearchaeota archaeon]|nr:hypothetical protein [Candidatus Woesearchaeota archaeon]
MIKKRIGLYIFLLFTLIYPIYSIDCEDNATRYINNPEETCYIVGGIYRTCDNIELICSEENVWLLKSAIQTEPTETEPTPPPTEPTETEPTPPALEGNDLSYVWLENVSNKPMKFDEMVYAAIALNNEGKEVGDILGRIIEQEDIDKGCWVKGACDVKSTSLGLLSLYISNSDYTKEKDWILGALTSALKEGEWLIEIESSTNGTCSLKYTVNNNPIVKSFTIQDNIILNDQGKPTSAKYYISISKDLDSSLLTKVNNQIDIDCTSIQGNILITQLYRENNNYYILESVPSSSYSLIIKNGCFSTSFGSKTCDYESSLYATWSLTESGLSLNELGVQTYLETELDNNDLHRAMLIRILERNQDLKDFYLDAMEDTQRNDGAWAAGDIFTTSFSIFSLKNIGTDMIDLAISFLERERKPDGSWNGNVKDTSMALIAIEGSIERSSNYPGSETPGGEPTDEIPTGNETIPVFGREDICNDMIDNDEDDLTDCSDPDCMFSSDCGIASPGPNGDFTDLADEIGLCDDQIDNDNDFLIDCEDGECTFDSVCGNNICDNGEWDYPDEDDIDCGGICASECGEGDVSEGGICHSDSDCKSFLVCGDNGICEEPEGAEKRIETDCTDGFDNDQDGDIDCNDFDCDFYCAGKEPEEKCTADSDCKTGEECKNGVCTTKTTTKTNTTTIIIIIVIIVLIIGGIVFFYLVKTGKIKLPGGKKKSTFDAFKKEFEFKPTFPTKPSTQQSTKPATRPFTKPTTKSKEEMELDKSIKEAEELLKK